MKKIVFLIALLMTICFSASAQFDGFVTNDGGYSGREGSSDLPIVPSGEPGTIQDINAPLGSGLLIFTALGTGYALSRKRKLNN